MVWGTQGYRVQGYGARVGNEVQGYGAQGYGAHGQWGTGV